MFRKEAIFRRMKHYSREHDRSQSRVAELERRKTTCEAGLAAMAACWTQVRYVFLIPMLLLKPFSAGRSNSTGGKTGGPPTKRSKYSRSASSFFNPLNLQLTRTVDIFDISSHISDDQAPDLASALEDNMQATQNLVTKFVSLGSSSQFSGGDAYIRCQKVQTEVSTHCQYNSFATHYDDSARLCGLRCKLCMANCASARPRSTNITSSSSLLKRLQTDFAAKQSKL